MKTRSVILLTLLLLGRGSDAAAVPRLQQEQVRLDSLQSCLEQLADSLDRLDRSEQDQLQQLDGVRRRIDLSRKLLTEATSQTDFLQRDLQRITQELERLQARETALITQERTAVARRDTLQQCFRTIVRDLYMALPLPWGTYLLTAGDSESLIRRHAFMQNISQAVQDRKAQLRSEIELTAALQDSVSQVSRELSALRQTQHSNLAYQQRLREEQTQRLAELDTDRDEYQRTLARLRADKQLWEAYQQQRREALTTIEQRLEVFRRAQANRETALQERQEERQYARSRLGEQNRTEVVSNTADAHPERLRAGQTPWPIQGRITQRFGIHRDPATGATLDNPGIDISCNNGLVRAVAAGKVLEATWLPGFGQTLLLEHDDAFFTVYAGLTAISVTPGQSIPARAELGSATDQLHFEIWRGQERQDPARYLTPSP